MFFLDHLSPHKHILSCPFFFIHTSTYFHVHFHSFGRLLLSISSSAMRICTAPSTFIALIRKLARACHSGLSQTRAHSFFFLLYRLLFVGWSDPRRHCCCGPLTLQAWWPSTIGSGLQFGPALSPAPLRSMPSRQPPLPQAQSQCKFRRSGLRFTHLFFRIQPIVTVC